MIETNKIYNMDCLDGMKQTYNVLYVDPPWNYNNKRTGGSMKSGASQQYDILDEDGIVNIIRNIPTTESSVIFLWSTTPMIKSALSILEKLGFTYKTQIVWIKTGRLGMGFWVRVQTEFLLLGVKGKVAPFRSSMRNFVMEKPGKHSVKPIQFYDIIEKLTAEMPDRKMIEIFARNTKLGWDSFGNELEIIEEN